jgi:hypothetical protein
MAGDEVFAVEFGRKVIPGHLAFPEDLEPMRNALAEGLDPNWSTYQKEETAKRPPGGGRAAVGGGLA